MGSRSSSDKIQGQPGRKEGAVGWETIWVFPKIGGFPPKSSMAPCQTSGVRIGTNRPFFWESCFA